MKILFILLIMFNLLLVVKSYERRKFCEKIQNDLIESNDIK